MIIIMGLALNLLKILLKNLVKKLDRPSSTFISHLQSTLKFLCLIISHKASSNYPPLRIPFSINFLIKFPLATKHQQQQQQCFFSFSPYTLLPFFRSRELLRRRRVRASNGFDL